MRQRLFFGLHLSLGAKSRTEIELFSLTKLCKNISLPWNLLNLQKIDAYASGYYLPKNQESQTYFAPSVSDLSGHCPLASQNQHQWICKLDCHLTLVLLTQQNLKSFELILDKNNIY